MRGKKKVKVLKYGKQYATCNKCHSIIEFEDGDVDEKKRQGEHKQKYRL